MIKHIAFYGTLTSSHSTSVHHAMKKALRYKGMCIVPGKLYQLGRYPGLKPESGKITAELYEILDDKILEILDKYEATDNIDPSLPGFSRKPVELLHPNLMSWIYYYDGQPDETAIAKMTSLRHGG